VPSTSYFGSAGTFWHWSNSTDRRLANGIFVTDPATPVKMAGISDGTSNTIAIGEKASQLWAGGSFLGVQHSSQVPGGGNDAACCAEWFMGMGLFAPNYGYTPGLPADSSPSGPYRPHSRGFSSSHAGGVQFAFMDGKVGFISENVDHPRDNDAGWSQMGAGCYWRGGAANCSGAEYDNKQTLGAKFGVYQRLHSRNDGLPVRPGT
ncbi:MAG: DUF1559 domain-containing protein, partial [Planctomycetaceae bacterium]